MKMKALTPRRGLILICTLAYAIGFYSWFIFQGNYEFSLYLVEFFALIVLACVLLSRAPDFPDWLLVLLSFVGLMHVAGGGVIIEGVRLYSFVPLRLYDAHLPGFVILKYDQIVHTFGFGVAALSLRWLLVRYAPGLSRPFVNTLAIFAALGLGALNEISEFSAVVSFSRTGVGGYYNTALDLVSDLAGALIAIGSAEAIRWLRGVRNGTKPLF